ncbi:MAG: hypothetical protein AB1689_28820 [Thermodesulfobacteriota bacterium]
MQCGRGSALRAVTGGLATLAFATLAIADEGKPSGMMQEGMVQATAKVLKVDKAKRLVTFEGEDGDPVTMQVPDKVRNFDQIDPGDQLVVTYYESVGYEVRKANGDGPSVGTAAEVDRAKLGQKPGVTGAQAVTLTMKITGIDKKESEVTLEGPDGTLRTVKVRDASKLDRVEVGDLVDITFTEAIAVTVETPDEG